MNTNKNILTEEHTVAWDNISMNNNLYWADLNRMLQQAAVNHAEQLGFGFTDISKENISWVLFRLHIEVIRLPKWKEKITVKTWPSEVKSLSAFREFEMHTQNGELLCNASSEWLIIDMKTRKPRRVEEFHKFDGVMTPRKTLTVPVPKYNAKGDFIDVFSDEVRFSNMDMNGHMNAKHYFVWFADAFYKHFGNKEVSFLSMTYFNECLLGEKITIQQSVNDTTVFRGMKQETGKIAFLAKAVLK